MSERKAFLILLAPLFAAGHLYAQDVNLKATTGHEVGMTISEYKYTESDAAINGGTIKQKANKAGIDYSYVKTLDNDWLVKGDVRYAAGKTDYSFNRTTLNGIKDWYFDLRGLVGKEVAFSDSVVLFYGGLGYRYSINDSSGRTANTGERGYYRNNELSYVPAGLAHKTGIRGGARLVTTGEVDFVIRGEQHSRLSDVNSALPDVINKQKHGYGLRAGVMYEKGPWSIGPWITYWRINKSETVTVTATILGSTFTGSLFEPGNVTTEIGLRAAYRF